MRTIACAILFGAAAGYVAAYGAATENPAAGGAAPRKPAPVLDAPAPERPLPTDPHELEVAYAEVFLKLARLDLQKMMDLQNRIQGAITTSQFDRVEGLVRVAEDNLRLVKEGNATRAALNLVRARESLRTVEHILKTAQQVRASANAISDTEMARLRTSVELERLALARAEVAAKTDSPIDDLALEMDQMRDEMMRLRYRFEALTARR